MPARARVSVVIPVKDDAPALTRCLRALAAQTVPVDEIVVVDNASSDASAAVARDAGAVVVWCPEPGIPAASAAGYDRASGELILRLDADCVPDTGWVDAVVRAFDRHPRVGAVTAGARFVDGPAWLRRPVVAVYLGAYAAMGWATLGHSPLFGSNLAMRRDAWRRVSARVHRRPDVHDDLDLAYHLGEHDRIRYLPGARMGMSMRPFAAGRGFARRVARGFRTVLIHWPGDFPPVRWDRLVLRRTGLDRRLRLLLGRT